MDEAYRWTSFIADQDERRLVLMRSLLLPDTAGGRPCYVWTWRRLQKMTGLHRDTLKARWGRGIDRIVRGLNEPVRHSVARGSAGFSPDRAGKPAEEATGRLHLRPLGGLPGHARQKWAIRTP